MVAVLMMSAKLATLSLFKIKVIWNIGYDVSTSAHEVTNKILSHSSNYIVEMVMWPKFCNSFSIYMREVIITSILQGFVAVFFERYSWLKFNNLGLVLCTVLRFYTSVAKGLKLKVREFLGKVFSRTYRRKNW